MKLIIDIPDEEYNECIERNEWDTLSLGVKLIQAVQNSTPLLEELEKIKAEFEEIECLRDNPYNNETEYSVSMEELRELFDKHISELKGENK